MRKNINKNTNDEMYKAILRLESVDECVKFFEDLCSISEIRAMEQRFHVARLLHEGMIYNQIQQITGASSATISRVNRSLQFGADGYEIVFARADEEKKKEAEK